MIWSNAIHVFAGPSLFGADLPDGICWHGPASAGDMLALANGPACTLVLIDGYFERARSPWHKEILHLLAKGFRVIGAASMGALRAAELDRHGMLGAGAIYRAYQRGLLVGDDEVAVLHAPAELGYRPLTVAMVDLRASLNSAVRLRNLAPAQARQFRDSAMARNFRDRDHDWLASETARRGLPPAFLNHAEHGQKRRDSLAAIALARQLQAVPPLPELAPPATRYLLALLDEVLVGDATPVRQMHH